MAPKFWMEGSRLTMTFFLAMVRAPLARFTVTIMGSISGVSPTAMERPNRSASSQLPLVMPTIKNTAQTMTTMNRIMSQVKERTPRSKLVSSASLGQPLRNGPEQGPCSGIHHQAPGRAAGDGGPQKAGVGQLSGGSPRRRVALSRLLDGHGLSGQGRLADEEILGGKQPQVRRDDGTGLQENDIAGNDFRYPDLGLLPVSQDKGPRLNALAQSIHGLGRSTVQNVGKSDAEQNHRADDHGRLELADERGDKGDEQQLNDQRALATVEDVGPEAQALAVRQFVRAILVQTAFRLFRGQPSKGRVERGDRLLNGDRAEIRKAALIFGLALGCFQVGGFSGGTPQ